MTFNIWQAVRIIAFGWILSIDIPLLQSCMGWVNDLDGEIKKYGWNDLMYNIAMASVCGIEQKRFYFCAGCTFLALLYITYETHLYLEEVNSVPRHLLKVPKDLTSEAWYAHPTGEKQYMLNSWGINPDKTEETIAGMDHRVSGSQWVDPMQYGAVNAPKMPAPAFAV